MMPALEKLHEEAHSGHKLSSATSKVHTPKVITLQRHASPRICVSSKSCLSFAEPRKHYCSYLQPPKSVVQVRFYKLKITHPQLRCKAMCKSSSYLPSEVLYRSRGKLSGILSTVLVQIPWRLAELVGPALSRAVVLVVEDGSDAHQELPGPPLMQEYHVSLTNDLNLFGLFEVYDMAGNY